MTERTGFTVRRTARHACHSGRRLLAPLAAILLAAISLALPCPGAEAPGSNAVAAVTAAVAALPDPLRSVYDSYTPDFVDLLTRHSGYGGALQSYTVPKEMMDLSSEKNFYTLCRVNESDRANALVEAGIQREQKGFPREAIEIYQKVIDAYPDALFRVSRNGVFAPVGQYCQMRILQLPLRDLGFYRDKHDERAREAYEQARSRNSLEGLAEVRDRMLATSYGAPSLLTLGYSALDKGHYQEALEYFETVWDFLPEQRTVDPALAMSMALCRKMLAQGGEVGERQGLVGYWKFDEGRGDRLADASGFGTDGAVQGFAHWVPGKTGTALRFDWTNAVSVRAATFHELGTGGAGYAVAFWLNLERPSPHNDHFLFLKNGASADEMIGVSAMAGGRIGFTLATESPVWETAQTRNAVGLGRWTHVALVKARDNTVRLYLDGRLDTTATLKAPALRNTGAITVGRYMYGAMDEVRVYNRPLLDREVATLAGTLGTTAPSVAPASGEAPLAAAFAAPAGVADKAACFWEFGDGETARGRQVRHTYGLGGDYTATLTVTDPDGAIAAASATVAVKWRPKDEGFAGRMARVTAAARPGAAADAEAETIATDDHAPMPPSADPMGYTAPAWRGELAGARNDQVVYTQPVVTKRSVIYRHKNIVYCRSILNGEILWQNNMGGRVTWQNRYERQYPQEGVLVQDGLVFTVMHKVGPSLVALDEVTGQLKWAYGPAVASTREESRLRFEATPAGGPESVFAGYIQDNIEGETHIDTEYGVMCFDSSTGRLRWRRELCRFQPGLFSAGFAEYRRNRIRSWSSPPLYHEGTVYHVTDAGVVAAIDALSGRVKWLMRYPSWPMVHDATRVFGGLPGWSGTVFTDGMHEPSFWHNQRPWIVGDRLYVLPVDSTMMHCLNRRTGKVEWSRIKSGGSYTYMLGPTHDGYLVLATSGRGGIVHLIDQTSGKTVWTSPDPIIPETHPVMTLNHDPFGSAVPGGFNNRGFFLVAQPFLTSDDRLCTSYFIDCGFSFSPWCMSLAEISLRDRKILDRRRYYIPAYQALIRGCINTAKERLKQLEDIPHKDDNMKKTIEGVREITLDTVPENAGGAFLPFARTTFARSGVPFELRVSTRQIEMVYDREAVKRALGERTDAAGLFARAELALGESRLKETAGLMQQALAGVSAEDLDFRAVVNQQLHLVYKRLAQASVRNGQKEAEMANCLGMSQTVVSLPDEMETLLALGEAYARKGDARTAARIVRNLVSTYGHYDYLLPSLLIGERDTLDRASQQVLGSVETFTGDSLYGREFTRSAKLTRRVLGLYFSALSPLRKDLKMRAGELGAQHLLDLRREFPDLRQEMEKEASDALLGRSAAEQLFRLWEYPGTAAAQKVLDEQVAATAARLAKGDATPEQEAELRRREWALADAARICGLALPDAAKPRLLAPADAPPPPAIGASFREQALDLQEERGPSWLVLERHGAPDILPGRLFRGARVQKKLDKKFLLYCLDTGTGKVDWKAQEKRNEQWSDEIRLGEKGEEPGFFEAFVFADIAVVHGMYDVLAFDLKDGKLRWRFVVPSGFEIRHAVMSGNLLVLSGDAESVALHLGTRDPRGEVAWQQKEEGSPYTAPYFVGDRLVGLRKMPANLTVRYRATGKLIGQLTLPDLTLFDEHPLLDKGPRALPVAHDGPLLAVTDGWYYLMVDVAKMRVLWKRLIDQNDASRPPPMRFAMTGDYLAVVKQDYDVKAIHMLSSRTGDLLWRTDPKVPGSPQPIDTMLIRGDRLYGIRPHPGQGFYFAGLDCRTGANLFPPNEQKGYGGKPDTMLRADLYGKVAVALVRDRQDYEVKAFDTTDGRLLHALKVQGVGEFGEHGRASATVQDGSLILLGRNDLKWTMGK